MLFGRDSELGRLTRLVADAMSGASAVLVVHGEAGVGKTALLDHLAAETGPAKVLRTTGVESEADLPFAALHRLLRPALDRLEVLPRPQADALRAAFGLVAPGQSDRFLIGLAVLTLLSEYGGEDPVLCLVDDAQWLDSASMDALAFAARRLDCEGVVMVFAQREAPRLGLPELRLDGLDEDSTSALLAAGSGAGLPANVLDRVVAQARGNPLALMELPRALSEEERSGQIGPMPLTPSARVQEVFRSQIAALPERTRTVLLVAAADDTGQAAVVLAAAGATPGDLEPAEQAGLIQWTGSSLAFRHPLVRTAAYHSGSQAQRIAAHLGLAAALGGDQYADRRAWHRAAAAIGPDEDAASALVQAARRAEGRDAVAAAAAAYERAAQLTADPVSRTRRMIAAAQAAADAGQFPRVAALLDRVEDTDSNEFARARAALELNSGSAATAVQILLGRMADAEPAVMIEACHAALSAGDAALLADVCKHVAGHNGVLDGLVELTTLRGPVDAAVFAHAAQDSSALFSSRFLAAYLAHRVGNHRDAYRLTQGLLAFCRTHGLHGWQATCLHLLAETQLDHGDLDAARRTAEEGLRIAEYGGHDHRACHLRSTLAAVAALRGDAAACRELADSALVHATGHQVGTAAVRSRQALALLHLGSSEPEPAYAHLAQVRLNAPILAASTLPDLIEAGIRTGAPIGDAVETYERWAATTTQPLTAALAARCRAFISDDSTAERHYERALRHHESAASAASPIEHARTELLYGEWLRRRRRRTDARQHLRSAMEAFERSGAQPWAERARTELRGTGEAVDPTRRTSTVLDRLTPQEREVVRLAAAGATNRDIATQLFLSPRTVGHHLYRAFPKLGITSRNQLAQLVE